MQDLQQKASPNLKIVLIGNKSDKLTTNPNDRAVSINEASQLANTYGFEDYIETSAFNSSNIDAAFMALITAITQEQRKHAQNGEYNAMN